MGELSVEMKRMLENYNEGLELYRARRWDEAVAAFNRALETAPDDGPSRLYLERCEECKKNPPPENWDGVFCATTK